MQMMQDLIYLPNQGIDPTNDKRRFSRQILKKMAKKRPINIVPDQVKVNIKVDKQWMSPAQVSSMTSSSPSKIHQKVNGSKSTQAITDSLSVIQKEKKTLPNINMNHGTYDMSERRQLKKSCKKTSRLKNM